MTLIMAIIRFLFFFSGYYPESLSACKQRLCNSSYGAANFVVDQQGEHCNAKGGCHNRLNVVPHSHVYHILYQIPEY